MKRLCVLFSLAAAFGLWADPVVSNVSVSRAGGGAVNVDYALSEEAIVTVSFVYDGVAVPAAQSTFVARDVNRLVPAGARTIVWRPDDGVFAAGCDASKLVAHVTAWPKANPPDYLVCNLYQPKSWAFYPSAEAIPYGITNRMYKGEYFALRRIPAKDVVWRMGQNGNGTTAIPHLVKLTADYYFSVYPLTREQYHIIAFRQTGTGVWFGNGVIKEGISDLYAPLSNISPVDFRGYNDWPSGDHSLTNNSCPLAYCRRQTGLALDLPTDAQWEFAARYGGTGESMQYANAQRSVLGFGNAYGWCGHWNDANGYAHQIEVGLFPPSAAGLYDLHGNIFQVCLDYLSTGQNYANHFEGQSPVVDPVGCTRAEATTSGDKGPCRSCRGGVWSDGGVQTVYGRTGGNQYETFTGAYMGFRLVCPLPYGE